jgi:polyisoprenoid-binding protein YceI
MRTVTAACAAALLTASTSALVTRAGAADVPLTLSAARVVVDGTSNVHDWTASTTAVVLTAVDVATSEGDVLQEALQPGSLKRFEVTIPARGLTSPREGIDKNMHKALKVEEHPHITFRLRALDAAAGGHTATGMLTIAGVEREVVLNLQVEPKGRTLAVTGTTNLLMTDFGIKPPSAMLGMVKASPKITIRLELTVTAS